jgi:hypothetical protein
MTENKKIKGGYNPSGIRGFIPQITSKKCDGCNPKSEECLFCPDYRWRD